MVKYLDQAGLIKLIGSLKEKNDARYLKVGETFAADVKFTNANLNGGAETTVSKALEVLIQNIVRQEQEAFDQASNMKAIEALISGLDGKIDGVGQDLADEAAKVKALEDKVGKAADENGEGAEGLFAAVDANAAAIAAEVQDRIDADKELSNRIDGIDLLIGNGEGSGNNITKRIADLEADAELHADKTELEAAVQALQGKDNELAAAIAKLNAGVDDEDSVAAKVKVAKDAADAAQDAADAAQADVDALEKYVKGVEGAGGLEQRIAANEAFVEAQDDIDAEQDRRLGVLEGKFVGSDSVDAKINKVAQDLTEALEAQAEKDQAQDEAINAKVAKDAYDVKVKALEDEDARIAGLVATEQGRAEGVEQGLQAAINAINAAETGILDQAKAYADQQDQAAAQTQKQKDDAQDVKIAALQLAVGGGEEGQSLDEKIEAAEQSAKDEAARLDKADRDAQKLVDDAQDERIKALEDANAEGGAIKEAIDAAQATADDAKGKIDAFLDANAVKDETINTLKEIQGYIEEHGQDAAGMVEDIAAAQKAADDAQAAVDAVEEQLDKEGGLVDRLEVVEGFVDAHDDTARDARIKAIEDSIADGGAVDARFDALETFKNDHSHAAFATTAAMEQADGALDLRIKAFETNGANDVAAIAGRVGDIETSIASGAVDQRFDAVEKAVDDLEALFVGDDSVDAKIAAAEKAAKDEAARLDGVLKKELQDEIDADVKVVADDLAQEITDRKDAVKTVQDDVDANEAAQKLVNADFEARIAAFESEEPGSVKAQVKDVQDALDAFEEAQAEKDNEQDAAIAKKAEATALEALEELVGVPANDDEPASGLFLALQEEKERAEGEEGVNAENIALNAVAIQANADAIAAIKDGTTIDSFADVEAKFAEYVAITDTEIETAINTIFAQN